MRAEVVRKEPAIPVRDFDKETLRSLYETMVKIRHFEEKVEEFFFAGEIPGFVHLYIGEEAVAAGVMANLRKTDYIQSTHRGHGHTIAKGADLKPMMAEIFGKKSGYCKGKGGSMHIADFSIGMLGANGIVGGFHPRGRSGPGPENARNRWRFSCFFGDGASNRGTFHEGINLAAAWKLPVIFVCENNHWASTTPYHTTTAVENIADRALGYDITGVIVDGNDVFAVYEAAQELIERARRGSGPALLEAKTYRIKGHFVGDPEKYRTKEEVQKVFDETDPIPRFEQKVIEGGVMSKEELTAIEEAVKRSVAEAVEFARNAPEPEPFELFEDLYV